MVPRFIETSRLVLRNLKQSDLVDFLSYRSDADVVKYQGFNVMTSDLARAFIEEMSNRIFGEPGEWLQIGIEEKASGRLIGDCAVLLPAADSRMAEIGITLSPIYQSKGFARESVLGLLRFLFTDHLLHRVYAITDKENLPAIALMQSIPFRKEGEFIEHVWFKGRWSSEIQFAMLKSEWDQRNLDLEKNSV